MKLVSKKVGNKTTYRLVPDDFNELDEIKPDAVQGDMTTTLRRSMSYCDIAKEDWDSIFKHDNGCDKHN